MAYILEAHEEVACWDHIDLGHRSGNHTTGRHFDVHASLPIHQINFSDGHTFSLIISIRYEREIRVEVVETLVLNEFVNGDTLTSVAFQLCHYSETSEEFLGSSVGNGLAFSALVVLESLHGLGVLVSPNW